MERVVRAARRRPEQAWRAMGGLIAAGSLWQGFGYAIKGDAFTTSLGWGPLETLLRPVGGLHAHGVIMVVLGFALAVDLRGPYDAVMMWTLRLLRTYCLVVAFCWFSSWLTYGVSWGQPGWWLLLAALTTWMTWYAPTLRAARDPRKAGGSE